ncbi:MAG: alpha-glucosidase [Anaerolineae bacterium]|nr:alpha-glucosidase [Anaerolineae bacterium]
MTELKWWQQAVFYQIYPRSFADGNGDGIGDFKGMIEKLAHLKDLGVDALWLSPHYPSPQADCGYDVADYTTVAPEYGTLEDFQAFLAEAHARGLRVILDMVFNHTSDQHAWFLESRASRDNPKRDWYIWRDGRTGDHGERLPPNNWEASFTGSAWEYDPATDQYYYHFFLKEQPDLNWRNPEVRQAMWEAVRFWLDLDVDGFRLDAIGTIFEDPGMPDHEAGHSLLELYKMYEQAKTPEEQAHLDQLWEKLFEHQVDRGFEMHPLMKALRRVIDEYEDRVLVAEDGDIAYHGSGDDELHLVFNFPLMRVEGRLTPPHIRKNQAERLAELPEGAWPCNTLGNHDSPRVKSRFGDGEHDDALARLSAALMLTLRGTPFLYNGEEIGMTNTAFSDLGELRDTLALRQYDLAVNVGGMPPEMATALVCQNTRDSCRTPMQWANAPNAGFSPEGVETWLKVNPNYASGVNVAGQLLDPASLLNFYKRLLAVRKQTPALVGGDYTALLEDHEACLCFLRSVEAQTCLVVLNFSAEAHTLSFDHLNAGRLVFSSRDRDGAGALAALEIAPFEIYIADVSPV